jgi:hypothetical protein
MIKLRERFTKWYYRKGYRMTVKEYDITYEMIFQCPLWVRPLVEWLFSPSVYYREVGYEFSDGLDAGFGGL